MQIQLLVGMVVHQVLEVHQLVFLMVMLVVLVDFMEEEEEGLVMEYVLLVIRVD